MPKSTANCAASRTRAQAFGTALVDLTEGTGALDELFQRKLRVQS